VLHAFSVQRVQTESLSGLQKGWPGNKVSRYAEAGNSDDFFPRDVFCSWPQLPCVSRLTTDTRLGLRHHHASTVPDVPGRILAVAKKDGKTPDVGSMEIQFCSTRCLRRFLKHAVDELDRRVAAVEPEVKRANR
jgi:hypothetical protein